MKVVEAKCMNCGAKIKVNAETKDGICQYCGAYFSTQDVINHYNTSVVNNTVINNNISAGTVNILNGSFENFFSIAVDSWNSKDYDDAYDKFNKALEIDPNNRECVLYKALSFAILKRRLDSAVITYERVYKQLEFSNVIDRKFAKDFIEKLYQLNADEYENAINDFNPDVIGMSSIQKAWDSLEKILNSEKFIISVSDKIYAYEKEFENDYIDNMDNAVETYDTLTRKWKRIMSIDERYQVSEYHPDVDKLLDEREELIAKIKKIKPEYDTGTKKSGCYIATCIYGSYDCPQVWTLRRYRDYTLDNTWHGRLFIKLYYKISPTLVKWFGGKKWFQKYWKRMLDKKVEKLNEMGVSDSRYSDRY